MAVLVARNVVEPALPAVSYVPTNLAVGAVLAALARRGGSSWEDLGLAHRHARHGLRTAGPVAVAAMAGMLVGASLPVTRGYFDDERVVVDAGAQELAYQTIWRIPVGTVAFEELAFRGVLLDLLRGPLSLEAAVAADSVIFGLWHIVPTLATATANDIIGRRRVALVVGSVLATAVGGVILATLRLRGRHLLAPALLHLAFNDFGYLLSWWVRS